MLKKNRINKIHRRYTPRIICNIPKGISMKLINKINKHDWHNNYDLIKLRRKLNMRIHIRSELRESLTILSSVLLIFCNYNLYNNYIFEIKTPFEIIAHSMNMLHIYSNGRKCYDPPLNALRTLEKLKYIIVLRGKNPDTGYNKPLRIWLTKKFFTSRNITIRELRFYLSKYEKWVIKNNFTSNILNFNNRHLLKMRAIGIDLFKKPSLRNLLIKERRLILGDNFINKIKLNIRLYNNLNKYSKNFGYLKYFNKKNNYKNKINNNNNIVTSLINNNKSKFWYCKFINWSLTKMPYEIILLEKKIKKKYPELIFKNSEMYYKILFKKGKKSLLI